MKLPEGWIAITVDGKAVFLNSIHIIGITRGESGLTLITTVDDGYDEVLPVYRAKETPEEIFNQLT